MSEPDDGQTDAINKGYQRCSGDIFAWINADDSYTISAMKEVAHYYSQGYQLIAGSCKNIYFDKNSEEIINSVAFNFSQYLRFWTYSSTEFFPQPSVFLDKKVTDNCFPLDTSLYCAMDHQFFLKALSQKPKTVTVKKVWACFKYHGLNKTGSDYSGSFEELYKVSLVESNKLPIFQRKIFQTDLGNYMILRSLIYKENPITIRQIILTLFDEPSVGRLILFWKIFFKTLLGENLYSTLKNFQTRI